MISYFQIFKFSNLQIAIAALCLVLSCKSKEGYSGDHLQPKVMQKVLLDINLAEAYSTFEKDTLHKAAAKNMDSLSFHYKDIFAHYNITQAQFIQSLDWYKNHPGNLDTLYNNLIPIVTKLQDVNKPKAATLQPTPVQVPSVPSRPAP